MNLFIHLKTLENSLDFFIPKMIDGAVNANADNYSTSEVIQIIIRLLSECDKAVMFVEGTDTHDSGSLKSILMSALKSLDQTKVYISGSNDQLMMMANKLNAEKITFKDIEKVALDYFNE